jgi:hypothetical protein
MDEKLKQLKELVDLQCVDGTWNYDQYHFGFANGLILALAIMMDQEPTYLVAPDEWIADYEDSVMVGPT